MQPFNRRKFLGIVGAGSVTAAATTTAAVHGLSQGPGEAEGKLVFRAEAGLPARPWPAYATAIAEGSVDLRSRTGVVATRLVAGAPGNRGDIGLPGTARVVRINSVSSAGSQVRFEGVVEDRSVLAKGESASKQFVLDRGAGQLHTEVSGAPVVLSLVP
jgi:hypothetical protein